MTRRAQKFRRTFGEKDVQPIVQVAIPSTRPKLVGQVVEAARHNGLGAGLIVVDDSVDGAVSKALEGDATCTVLRTNGAGPATARNAAVEHSTAPWILFLDDDVALPADFGKEVCLAIESAGDEVAIIECRIVAVGVATPPYWRRRLVETNTPGGFLAACMLVRREPYLASGGMRSTARDPFREDTDLGLRVLALGYKSQWRHNLWVMHPLETMSLRRYLRTGWFLRHDAVFNRLHPGYLNQTGRAVGLGRLSLRGLRRRLPLAALGLSLVLLAVGRASLVGAAGLPWILAGLGLHVLHLRALERAGFRPQWWSLIRPDEVAAHTCWALTAAAGRLVGEAELLMFPGGSWRDWHHES